MQKPALVRLYRAGVKLFVTGMDVFVILLLAFLIVRAVIGERSIIVAIGNSYLHLFLLGALIWFLAALFRRRWRIAFISFVSVVFFVSFYGAAFIPRITSPPADSVRVKAMTYNPHSEQVLLDPMLAVIQAVDADVVAVQELSVEAAARFTEAFASEYPYQAFHTSPNEPVIGQGVLSRFPIVNNDYWRNDLPERLAHQRVQLNVEGHLLTLYNTHPIHPFAKSGQFYDLTVRTQEIRSVLDRAQADSGPVLIAGDFNKSDQSADYQLITATYSDSYREVGWGMGFTFPDFRSRNAVPGEIAALPLRPIVRLDYIFHSRDLLAVEAHVWPSSGGSDHRPVWVDLALAGSQLPLTH